MTPTADGTFVSTAREPGEPGVPVYAILQEERRDSAGNILWACTPRKVDLAPFLEAGYFTETTRLMQPGTHCFDVTLNDLCADTGSSPAWRVSAGAAGMRHPPVARYYNPTRSRSALTLTVTEVDVSAGWEWIMTHQWFAVVGATRPWAHDEGGDSGRPGVLLHPGPSVMGEYHRAAGHLMAAIEERAKALLYPGASLSARRNSAIILVLANAQALLGECLGDPLMDPARSWLYWDACIEAAEARRLEFGHPQHRPTTDALMLLAAYHG